MTRNRRDEEEVLLPLETIGNLTYSPGTDIPYGKPIRLGLTECMIYGSANKDSYHADILAHLEFIKHTQATEPVMLDDRQFTLALSRLTLQGLIPFHKGLWRSHFIVGWICVSLGIAAEQEGTDA